MWPSWEQAILGPQRGGASTLSNPPGEHCPKPSGAGTSRRQRGCSAGHPGTFRVSGLPSTQTSSPRPALCDLWQVRVAAGRIRKRLKQGPLSPLPSPECFNLLLSRPQGNRRLLQFPGSLCSPGHCITLVDFATRTCNWFCCCCSFLKFLFLFFNWGIGGEKSCLFPLNSVSWAWPGFALGPSAL